MISAAIRPVPYIDLQIQLRKDKQVSTKIPLPSYCRPFCVSAGMSASPLDCHRLYRFYWFSWAFVLATLLGIAATLLCNWGLHNR